MTDYQQQTLPGFDDPPPPPPARPATGRPCRVCGTWMDTMPAMLTHVRTHIR